jgi:hypothetical protein
MLMVGLQELSTYEENATIMERVGISVMSSYWVKLTLNRVVFQFTSVDL